MRVCIVTPYDLSFPGGVNRHATSLARALSTLGHPARVAGPASGSVPEGCDALGGAVAIPANGSIARVGLLVPPAATQEYLARGGFDVVHAQEPFVPGPARQALAWPGGPVVATFHGASERESLLSRALRRAASAPLSRLAFGIAVSRAAKRFARPIFRGRTAVIPNGVDPASFAPAPGAGRDGRPGGPLRVLFVGRFGEPRKGFGALLAAAALLRRRGVAVEIRVAGSGPAARFRAEGEARFLGALPDAALAAEYRAADVLCAPSRGGEGFGLILLEAMACGCPVVAGDIPGYAEAARGAALLVRPGEPHALAEALLRAGRDGAARAALVAAGRSRAAALAWSRVAARVLHVYRAAGAGGRLRAAASSAA